MGCFCHKTLDALKPLLPQLNVSASESLALPKLSLALSALLGKPGPLPSVTASVSASVSAMPKMQLSLAAIGTIAALADLRASVQQQFGIDLLVAAQASAFARIVATLNARLAALINLQLNLSPWAQLAALNAAIELALNLPSVSAAAALNADLGALAGPAVLLSAAARLDVDFSANASASVSAQLAATLRALLGISLPALAAPRLVANLNAALSALAQLQASLGMDPLKVGFAMAVEVISAKLQAALKLGLPIPPAASASITATLGARLALQATAQASLQAALQAKADVMLQLAALAAINWQVPPITGLPAVTIGLPVCALAAQLKVALGIAAAVRSAPCGPACDAAKVMRAAAASTA